MSDSEHTIIIAFCSRQISRYKNQLALPFAISRLFGKIFLEPPQLDFRVRPKDTGRVSNYKKTYRGKQVCSCANATDVDGHFVGQPDGLF